MRDIHNRDTVHRGAIIVLCHFQRGVFVPVRHHLTTITAPFMHEKGHHFSTMYAPFMREDRGTITPLRNPTYPPTGLQLRGGHSNKGRKNCVAFVTSL